MSSRREFLFGATASVGVALIGGYRELEAIIPHHGGFEFVLHRNPHPEGLPCGQVSSRRAGSTQSFSTVSLSMGAVDPSHVALSPDGGTLAVCAADGKLLNLLHVAPDGSLGEVFASHRRIFGERPANFVFESDDTLVVEGDRYRMIDAKLLRIG